MRRGTLIYIGCIIALLAVGLWLQLTQPRPVDWTATYDHKDTGPFGCAVFDSVMAFTLPAGYRPVAETLDDFLENDTVGGQNLLFVSGYCWLNDEDVDSLFLRLHRGASVLMAADWFSDALLDSLGIIEADGFVLDGLDGVPSLRPAIDTLEWVEEPGCYPRRDFPVRSSFQSTGFQPTDSLGRYPFRVLAWQRHDRVYAADSGYVARRMNTVSFRVGKGELTLMRSPFVLTNYGILHRDLKDYVLRLADRLKDAPLVRLQLGRHGLGQPCRWTGTGTVWLLPEPSAPAVGALRVAVDRRAAVLLHCPAASASHPRHVASGEPQPGVREAHRHALLPARDPLRPAAQEVCLLRRRAATPHGGRPALGDVRRRTC